jgi:hypothetical protein
MFGIKTVVAAVVVCACTAASAQQESMTREEVKAELVRAQAAGETVTNGEAWDGTATKAATTARSGAFGRPFAGAGLSREAVKAELAKARASGEMERRALTDYVGGN